MDPIGTLREKYKGNPHVLQRLDMVVANLPSLLATADADHAQQMAKRSENAIQKMAFIQNFLAQHQYYYISQTDQYVYYDESVYTLVTEDDVTHHLMVSMDRSLLRWKFKIRIHVLKRIKDHSIATACPDPITLGKVTRALSPCFFASKSYARYFLTVLGDALLGKRTLTYFMHKSFKTFMQLIGHSFCELLNKNIVDDFKYKYYDHDFKSCRILHGVCPERGFKIHAPDLAVCAMYLSAKYGSAEVYLGQCTGCEFATKVVRLSAATPATLVTSFLDEYTVPAGCIPYKSMNFLWRTFLQRNSLPFVVSQVNFKHILSEMGVFDAQTDTCKVGAKFEPALLHFHHFWTQFITPDAGGDTFEIAELVELYNAWCETKSLHLTAAECLAWLQQEWSANTADGKVDRIRCALWDKAVDIDNAVELFNQQNAAHDPEKMFEFYVANTQKHSKMIVTKDYFLHYIC
jgi:hypothetical protein